MEAGQENTMDMAGLNIGFRHRGRKESPVCGPLSADLYEGELVALMGVNGSGKSTLLRTLAGLQGRLGGTIRIRGRDLDGYSGRELAKCLAYVSTESVSLQGMTVYQLVAMGRYPHTNWFGSMLAEDREKVRHALELASLVSLAERHMDRLSDGERQRAMIARILAQDTQILVLDEPTAYLDISHRVEIIHMLRSLTRTQRRTVLFATHDLQLALREADRLWLLSGGKLREGAPEDLVLNGSLSEALLGKNSRTGVSLDMESGEFRHQEQSRIAAYISSEDRLLGHWTHRALERIGLRVESNNSGGLHVIASKESGTPHWYVEKNGKRIQLDSIYELSLYLRSNVKPN